MIHLMTLSSKNISEHNRNQKDNNTNHIECIRLLNSNLCRFFFLDLLHLLYIMKSNEILLPFEHSILQFYELIHPSLPPVGYCFVEAFQVLLCKYCNLEGVDYISH